MHQTVKLLYLFRKYSALAVVFSGAILVSITNMAAQGKTGSFLAGEWRTSGEDRIKNDMSIEAENSKRAQLSPISVASKAVNPEFKEDDLNQINSVEGKIVSAPSSPVLKDPEEDGGVEVYVVKDGDTVSTIAQKFDITTNTILWANDIEDVDEIKPGDQIFILPVAGLTHVVKKGENLDDIAKEYKAEKEKIISFNDNIPANGEIAEGQEIVIPGGQKDIPVPVQTDTLGIERRSYATSTGGDPKISGTLKLDGKGGTGHRFPYGYCTWYVAQKRYVPWGGNAGTWLYNAKARGYKTGKAPAAGAIMVSSESWWGHVAIVESVGKGTITVSEMNYKGWAKTSRRTIPTNSRVIKGFIY
ncbi:MAG: LysM peptidoglycan-binding domain-containing protein [Parcubacteria group bacterium]|jgi:surface antigen